MMQQTPLAALAGYRNGFAFKPEDRGVDGLPIVRIEQLLNPGVEPDLFPGEVPATNRIDDGDLIFSWSGTLAVRFWTRGPAYLNQHLFRVDPRPGVERRWLRWALDEAVGRMKPLMHGSAMTHITRRVLEEVRVPLPPEPMQRRIADYLDTETARIDGLLDQVGVASRLLGQRAAAVLDASVPGSIVCDGLGVPVRVEGWRCPPLYTVATVQKGFTKSSALEDTAAPTRPYLRVANVQDGFLALGEVSSVRLPLPVASRHELRAGDVLMTEGGDPDKLGRGTVWQGEVEGCLHQNHVFAVRPDARQVSSEYLALMTRTSYARMYFETTCSKTTGIASTSPTKIAGWRLPVPSLSDQAEIVESVDVELTRIRETQHLLDRQRALLNERRQALITAAVTGELEV